MSFVTITHINMEEYKNRVLKAAEFLKVKINEKKFDVKYALILGSGLGKFADELNEKIEISYSDIPHFPVSTVQGHSGKMIIGRIANKDVLVMKGRFHFYEGYHMLDVTFPIRVMSMLGITHLIVTNAAGGINRNFNVGDLMIITDHINLFGTNPLIGQNIEEWGPRFPDLSNAYTKSFIELCEKVACEEKIKVVKGVYAGLTGPSYETSAEIRFLKTIGADAVGMSTVPEVIVANHSGIKNILGISCITNVNNGESKIEASHEEVVQNAEIASQNFIKLLLAIFKRL